METIKMAKSMTGSVVWLKKAKAMNRAVKVRSHFALIAATNNSAPPSFKTCGFPPSLFFLKYSHEPLVGVHFDQIARLERFRCASRADDARNAEFPCDDSRMRSDAPFVRDDRARPFGNHHHVRLGHACYEHFAFLEFLQVLHQFFDSYYFQHPRFS